MGKFISDWVIIGTAGVTIDGREISETALQQSAKNYSKKIYTAPINVEHSYGFFGTVEELRCGKNESGKTTLEARFSPNANFINNQKYGDDKKFFSMELFPNFCKSGEWYLTGLAITDAPASIGIQEFSKGKSGVEFFTTDTSGKIKFTHHASFLEKTKNFFYNNENKKQKEESEMSEKSEKSEKNTLEMFDASLKKGSDMIEKLSAVASQKDLEAQQINADLEKEKIAKKDLQEKFSDLEKEKIELLKKIDEFSKQKIMGTSVPESDGSTEMIIC